MNADVALISPFPCQENRSVAQSGVAAYTAQLSRALSVEGLHVTVFAPKVDGEPSSYHVDNVRVERRYSCGSAAWLAAARAALDSGAPIVHVQYETFLYGGPASLAAMPIALANLRRHARGPVVTMHQVVDPQSVDHEFTRVHRVRVPSQIARLGLSTAQHAVETLSARTVVHERTFTNLVRSAVVVPIGLNMSDSSLEDDAKHIAAKRSLGLPTDRLNVLCFGYLAPYKGLEGALDAARIAGESVELTIVGGDHPRLAAAHDPYATDLRSRYGDVARFVGYVPDDDIAMWFNAADVLLLPYPRPFSSSAPLALALGYGTPVLCSPALADCIGAPDIVAAPIEPTGLADRLRDLSSAPNHLDELRLATQRLAVGRSWPEVARRHAALYEEVMHANRAPRWTFR